MVWPEGVFGGVRRGHADGAPSRPGGAKAETFRVKVGLIDREFDMRKTLGIGMLLAVSSLFAAQGQMPGAGSQAAAPVVRGYAGQGVGQVYDSEPAAGVSVRGDVENGVETVSSTGAATELRVLRGRADVTVHHPANHSTILVDLPGGQVSLLKDGLYTFNAATNTVRVLHGEAEAFHNAAGAATKVKETQQVAFFGDGKPKAVNAYGYELTADLLGGSGGNHGDGVTRYGEGFYGGYPYYAYGYPYGYGFAPYGYGYPFGVGLGFGYYGGFRGGYGGIRGFRR